MSARLIEEEPALAEAIKTLILYTDFDTGLRAKQCLEHVLPTGGSNPDCLGWWRLDLFHLLGTEEETAATADLLVMSLRADCALEPSVERWVMQWIDRHGDQDGALAVLLDVGKQTLATVDDMLSRLREATRRGPVRLFIGYVPSAGIAAELPSAKDFASQKIGRALSPEEDFQDQIDTGSLGWGIND